MLTIEKIRTILEGCGASLADVIKCWVFLHDYRDFQAMTKVYSEFFGAAKPARTAVQATLVEPGMKLEIDCGFTRPGGDRGVPVGIVRNPAYSREASVHPARSETYVVGSRAGETEVAAAMS